MSADVYVVEAKRTPFGSFGGALADVPAASLGTTAIKGVLKAASLAPAAVDEVIVGQVLAGGLQRHGLRATRRFVFGQFDTQIEFHPDRERIDPECFEIRPVKI